MKLLLIEDEYSLADMERDYFNQKGYEADISTDGLAGYHAARKKEYDAIILDVMLPHMNGFEILKHLREEGNEIPVLLLTARSELEDKLKGFHLGAEDYLTKPFALEELGARIDVLTAKKAVKKETADVLTFGDIELNVSGHILIKKESGVSVSLSSKEFRLLQYLMMNPGRILTKQQITDNIWGFESDAEYNHEEVYISFLRKKMKGISASATIETIRSAGYRLKEHS